MSSDARTLTILRSLATHMGGHRQTDIGAGELVELEGRGLIHAPGFADVFEPTSFGAQVMDGHSELDQDVPRVTRWQNRTHYKGRAFYATAVA